MVTDIKDIWHNLHMMIKCANTFYCKLILLVDSRGMLLLVFAQGLYLYPADACNSTRPAFTNGIAPPSALFRTNIVIQCMWSVKLFLTFVQIKPIKLNSFCSALSITHVKYDLHY